jgi:hypothetical protein
MPNSFIGPVRPDYNIGTYRAQGISRPTSTASIQIPNTLPSSSITAGTDRNTALSRRQQLEEVATGLQRVSSRLDELGSVTSAPTAPGALTNPDAFLGQIFANRPQSEAEKSQSGILQRISNTTRNFFDDRSDNIDRVNSQFGVSDAQKRLADTRTQFAEREKRLREELRGFDQAGKTVARPFVEDERRSLVAKGTAELADLAIIENAQAGNLQVARQLANDLIDQQYQDFQGQIETYKAELEQLKPTLNEEQQLRASQIQMALDERSRVLGVKAQEEKDKRGLIIQAASEGADQGTLSAMQSGSLNEALLLAGPWIGRLDRQQQNAQIAAINRSNQPTPRETSNSSISTNDEGETVIQLSDGKRKALSEIDFSDPDEVDSLPVGNLTKSVIQGFAKTKELTPTQRAQVLSDLQAIRFNPNTYIAKKLDTLVETWGGVPESSKGIVEGWKFWERYTNPKVSEFESQRTLLTREIARLFDVGVLSDQDVKSYNDAMPSRLDASLDVVVSKVAGIAGAATGKTAKNAGEVVRLKDGRTAIVGPDGDTLLDPVTGKPLQ